MTAKKGSTNKPDAELDAFAHHLAEVLRISRTSDIIPVSFYNTVGEAWTELQNVVNGVTRLYDSEEYIRLNLRRFAEQKEGGAE